MTRTRNEALSAKARDLAGQGMTQREVSAALGVPRRTLQSWGIRWQAGRPKVSDGQASARTARRRRQEQSMTWTQRDAAVLVWTCGRYTVIQRAPRAYELLADAESRSIGTYPARSIAMRAADERDAR